MKKLVFMSCFLLVGCAIGNSLFGENVDNENCIDIRTFKVFHAMYHNVGLAFECSNSNCRDSYYLNNAVLITGDKVSEDLYDGMIYKVSDDKCAVRDGVYKYETKNGIKTVSQIVFEYKNNCKTKEECQRRVYEAKENIYFLCLYRFELENAKMDEQYCECYGNSYIDNDGDAKAIKKECGKFPKFLSAK